jgi:tRNA (pseudouridine54-N1)-methyltransferase
MRRFVILGQSAVADADFSIEDIPGTSGRLDVLLRCLRAGLMFSHGIRQDTIVYLCLLGGPRGPRTLRFEGATARFLRPDERNLGALVRKILAPDARPGPGFVPVRHGVALAESGVEAVLDDLHGATPYIVEEGAPDIRAATIDATSCAFFLGDHAGFAANAREELGRRGAAALGLGPVSMHAEDAIAVVVNELDRRDRGA